MHSQAKSVSACESDCARQPVTAMPSRASSRMRGWGALLAIVLQGASASLSPDLAIAADAQQLLTGEDGGNWTASSETWGLSVPGRVPGDLLSDLQRGGVIGDPWFELGFLNTTTPGAQGAPLWDVGAWAYTTTFTPSPAVAAVIAAGGAASIVFDGVKMAARATLNGTPLDVLLNDQFMRFVVPATLAPGANTLTVTFSTSRDAANAEGRFSGASAGWVRLVGDGDRLSCTEAIHSCGVLRLAAVYCCRCSECHCASLLRFWLPQQMPALSLLP